MFCPQCGAEIASDRVRFCTHCRFPVSSMKEFIATETSKNDAGEEKKFYPLRQRDITIGAGLMLIGVLKALFLGMAGGPREGPIFYFFALGLMFSAFLLFSQLSPRQRGLTVGATIIFLGAILGAVAGLAVGAAPAILFTVTFFLIIALLWTRLARAFMRIFFDNDIKREKPFYVPPQSAFNASDSALHAPSPTPNATAVDLNTQQTLKAELVERLSITEKTTGLLKNK